ncbi:flagellin [Candidatus Liberibacter asiaticus]
MTSILTNHSAMSASQKLRDINYNLEVVQDRVSSGLRVSDAADNAAYWSIAQIMKSDNGALSAVSDAIGLGSSKVDIAKAGMSKAIDVMSTIKNKITAGVERGTDSKSIQSEITQLQSQLRDIARGSSFNGENWLRTDLGSSTASIAKSVIGSFIRDDNGKVQITTIDYYLDPETVLLDSSTDGTERYSLLDRNHKIKVEPQVLKDIDVSVYDASGTISTKKFKLATTSGAWLKAANATFDQAKGIATIPVPLPAAPAAPNTTSGTSGSKSPSVAASATYIRMGNSDIWVRATTKNSITSDPGYTNSTVAKVGNTHYYVDTESTTLDSRKDLPKEIDSGYSMVTLNITRHANTDAYNEKLAMEEMVSFIDTQIKCATAAAGKIGSISSRIHLQEDFIKLMRDAVEKGVGRLVDADMASESTRLSALQTQQQLAVQALSIVNNSTARILSLFRG